MQEGNNLWFVALILVILTKTWILVFPREVWIGPVAPSFKVRSRSSDLGFLDLDLTRKHFNLDSATKVPSSSFPLAFVPLVLCIVLYSFSLDVVPTF
jgi:hypothetical protein